MDRNENVSDKREKTQTKQFQMLLFQTEFPASKRIRIKAIQKLMLLGRYKIDIFVCLAQLSSISQSIGAI